MEQQGRREDKPRGSFKGKYGDLAFRAIRNKRNKRSAWTVATKPNQRRSFCNISSGTDRAVRISWLSC